MVYGIDVSENNGYVDWQRLKETSNLKFAIIRSSFGFSTDSRFLDNVYHALENGFKCGAYHYSYALNSDEVIKEARTMKSIIEKSGVLLELPCFFDIENDSYKARNRFEYTQENVTNICQTFLDEIKPLNCGVYANLDWLTNYVDWQKLGCSIWSAQYNSSDDFKGYMWQYTDKLHLIGKNFDGDVLYLDEI